MTELAPGQLDAVDGIYPSGSWTGADWGMPEGAVGGTGSRGTMTAQDAKLRLALGVYEDPTCFWPTFEALLEGGIDLPSIGFVARRSVAAGLAGKVDGLSQKNRQAGSEFIATGNTLGAGGKDDEILFCLNLLSLWRRGFAAPALWVGDPAYRDLPTLNASLSRPVERGAVLMSVEPQRQHQLWQATRVLLQASSMPVRTLEYSPPPQQ